MKLAMNTVSLHTSGVGMILASLNMAIDFRKLFNIY